MSNVKCWNCGRTGHYGRDCGENWSKERTNSKGKESKGKSKCKTKGKGKGKLNNAECSNWQERWPEGKSQSYRKQDGQHADGWWKTTEIH